MNLLQEPYEQCYLPQVEEPDSAFLRLFRLRRQMHQGKVQKMLLAIDCSTRKPFTLDIEW